MFLYPRPQVEPLSCWEGAETQDPVTSALYKMIYVYTLRPDKVFGACRKFVGAVFGLSCLPCIRLFFFTNPVKIFKINDEHTHYFVSE